MGDDVAKSSTGRYLETGLGTSPEANPRTHQGMRNHPGEGGLIVYRLCGFSDPASAGIHTRLLFLRVYLQWHAPCDGS